MHNVFNIGPPVRREFLIVTLSVEGCTNLKDIVHFYSMRVTKFCTQGEGFDVYADSRDRTGVNCVPVPHHLETWFALRKVMTNSTIAYRDLATTHTHIHVHGSAHVHRCR